MKLQDSLLLLPSANLSETSDWYVENLGFRSVGYLESKEPHVCLYRDNVEIILIKSKLDKITPNRKIHGYGYDGYFNGLGVEKLYNELKDKVKIVRELKITDYNNLEFVIEDNEGRWICFGMKQKN